MRKTWIKIKRGFITDPKHRNVIGVRIWLFLYMLDRTDWETGKIFEWRDKHEAEDLGMSWRTLQDQRQQLEKDGYITSVQKGDHQEIIIHNWTNPREYTGEVYNPKDDEGTESSVQGVRRVPYGGTGKGVRKPRTPTLDSHIINDDDGETSFSDAPTFGDVIQAYEQQAGTITGFIADDLEAAVDEWEEHRQKLPDSHPDKQRAGEQVVIDAIAHMGKHINTPNLTYLDRVLTTWRQHGYMAEKPGKKKARASPAKDGKPPEQIKAEARKRVKDLEKKRGKR